LVVNGSGTGRKEVATWFLAFSLCGSLLYLLLLWVGM
jgi:hypothetical protein